MKTPILILLFFTSLTLQAQQEEYTAFLNQAMEAVENFDEEKFNESLNVFFNSMETDMVSAETLSISNANLLSDCLYELSKKYFLLSDSSSLIRAIPFLNYDLENNSQNMFIMGYMYERGYGVDEDISSAIQWFEKSAEKGNTEAMNRLGTIYYQRIADDEKAKEWYKKACDAGMLNACDNFERL